MSASARSNREDLFAPSSRREGKDETKDERPSARHDAGMDHDDGADASNPVQLEHLIGYSAGNPNSVLVVPNSDGLFIKR